MGKFLPVLIMILALTVSPSDALSGDTRTQKLNQNALGLLAGETEWLPQSLAIATALQHEEGLRILPIAGAGGLQAVSDLMHLKSVDAAIVSSDVIAYAQSQDLMQGLSSKISYVAKIAPLNVVLVAQRSIPNVTALAGKRIATGPASSSAFATGELIFGALEIPFSRVPQQGVAAIQALKRGRAEAALVVGADLSDNGLDPEKFHILELPRPALLSEIYSPAILTSDNAPNLIQAKDVVETVSVSLAIAVFNWPRNSSHFDKLRRFSHALFSVEPALSGTGNSTNLAAEILGWQRHAAAADALNSLQQTGSEPVTFTPQEGDGT